MTWLSALPVAVVALGWVLLPGLAVTGLLGVRGVAAWSAAPALSIGALAVSAVVAPLLGLPWSPATAAIGAAVLAGVALVLRRPTRGGPPRDDGDGDSDGDPDRDGTPGSARIRGAAALLGLTAAAAAAAVTTALGTGGLDRLSQTYDAVFHYNAVAEVLDTRNASSLVLGALAEPGAASAFYPAAWHDLVSLVVLTAGVPIPVASNVTAAVVAGVVWPLSCLLLVRHVVGRSAAAMLATPVVAVGFIAFPWSLMGFGVLWPNLLGLALLPVGLALVVALCGLGRHRALTRGQLVVVGTATVVALALAHPNTLFSLAVLALAPIGWWLATAVRALLVAGRWAVGGGILVALAAVAAAAVLVLDSPLLLAVRTFDWPAFQTGPQAAGEVLLNATNRRDAAWALSLVVVVGAVVAVRAAATSWLVPAHLLSGGLFLLAASVESPIGAALTGPWYNDSYRLAAMIPVTGVPLAVLGLVAVGERAAPWLDGVRPGSGNDRPGLRAGVLSAAATAVLVLASSGMYLREHADYLRTVYDPPSEATLLTTQHRAFLERAAALLPPDAVVAQNPWTGSAVLWALTDRKVLFPHLDGSWTADQRYLADHLDEVATDGEVCAAARRLGIDHVLSGAVQFWPWDPRSGDYPGLDDVAGAPGFELVTRAEGSSYALHRITACAATPGGAP